MTEQKHPKIWRLTEHSETQKTAIAAIAAQTGLHPICAGLLYDRGCENAETALAFLRCEENRLHDPFLLKDMEKAVARVEQAIAADEQITVFGDYDVDGVTAVSLLYLYLTARGAKVTYYIPSRSGEGYGLSCAAIDALAANGVRLIVTVDTGVTAEEEAAYAAAHGVDMVITDHHECRPTLPDAVAVVNPHRADCTYPFKELAGVGVVFKLVCALEITAGAARGEDAVTCLRRVSDEYMDLVALGTVADVMPLVDENRLIVLKGVSLIAKTPRMGLSALIDEATGGKKKKITSSFISFTLAPRINAAGRMADAARAVELLLAKTPERAAALAAELCEINRKRQIEENSVAGQVYRRIEEEYRLADAHAFVLEDDHWRQGIIGIVASRVTERYGLPTILVSFDGATRGFDSPDDTGKGSGRSVRGVNLVEALTACEDLLVKFGGHELAAGLTVRRGDLAAFRERFDAYAANCLPEGGSVVELTADAEIALADISLPLVEQIAYLEPFGVANPTPHFILRDLTIERISELGGGRHQKLLLTAGGVGLYGLCFSTERADLPLREGDRADVLCTLDINEYMGQRSVQLVVEDMRPSTRFAAVIDRMSERYRAVRAGAPFTEEERFIPAREDFARVYQVIRAECRAGNDTFAERTLLSMVNVGASEPINYVCFKYILEILRELRICGVEEVEEGYYRFDVWFNASKTSIEHSAVLKKLKSQCERGERR